MKFTESLLMLSLVALSGIQARQESDPMNLQPKENSKANPSKEGSKPGLIDMIKSNLPGGPKPPPPKDSTATKNSPKKDESKPLIGLASGSESKSNKGGSKPVIGLGGEDRW